jgi:glycosyltransferase involved in cell wall biosynthesis
MKILQVIPGLPKGGAEKVLVDLSNKLVDSGAEITLLQAFPNDPTLNANRLFKEINFLFVGEGIVGTFSKYRTLLFWCIQNRKKISKFDVVHCHLSYGLFFGLLTRILMFKKKQRPKLIFTCHAVGMAISRISLVANQLSIYFFDHVILVAEDKSWENILNKYHNSNKVCLIPNGVLITKNYISKETSPVSECFNLGSISRLEKDRNPMVFLQLAKLLVDVKIHLRFLLAGGGTLRNEICSTAEDLGLGNSFVLTGFISNPEDFLKGLDLYIALNVGEITGIAGLEAISAGIPTIAIQLDETHKTAESSWIWSSAKVKEVANKILYYAEFPNELNALALSQRNILIENYSIEKMTQRYLDVYINH